MYTCICCRSMESFSSVTFRFVWTQSLKESRCSALLCIYSGLSARKKRNDHWKSQNPLIIWIIIQAHIRNANSYSDTDCENLYVSLSNQWFSPNVIKVSLRVANNQIIDGKSSLQKSVILPIIRSVSPT